MNNKPRRWRALPQKLWTALGKILMRIHFPDNFDEHRAGGLLSGFDRTTMKATMQTVGQTIDTREALEEVLQSLESELPSGLSSSVRFWEARAAHILKKISAKPNRPIQSRYTSTGASWDGLRQSRGLSYTVQLMPSGDYCLQFTSL